MKILAIDPGTKCGWAISDVESGVWDLSVARHEGGGMRFIRLRKYLEDALPYGLIVYEEVRGHKGVSAAHIYGGVVAVIQAFGDERKIPYQGVPVGTIKKFATGKGNCNKDAMVGAAKAKYPTIDIIDDNHADALCILDWAMDKYGSIQQYF